MYSYYNNYILDIIRIIYYIYIDIFYNAVA